MQVITLTPKERQETPAVKANRLSYVLKAINVLGPSYPDLVGKAVNTAKVTDAMQSFLFLNEVLMKLQELQDRAGDLGINLENTSYNYTTDLYYEAERYVGDVEGADTIVQELRPLFANQGNQGGNPTPPVSE